MIARLAGPLTQAIYSTIVVAAVIRIAAAFATRTVAVLLMLPAPPGSPRSGCLPLAMVRCYRGHGEPRADSSPVPESLAWKLVRGTTTMVKRISADHIKLKRVYEKASPEDGTRVLVDRLWPRGLRKEAAAINHWFKEIAPSTELRKWFGHDPARWDEFCRRYIAELRQHAEQLDEFRKLARRGPITLVYAAHDELHNDAVVLRNVLIR